MSVLANSNVIGSGSSGGPDTGDIGHSLRCRSAASTYLNRTFGTPTSNTVWTSSLKVKRGSLGSTQALFTAGSGGLWFNASNQLNLFSNAGGSLVASVAVFRDPTSHYFIDMVSNGTTVKAYVNNIEVFSYTGTVTNLNSAIVHNIARHTSGANQYLDGYLSRICFVDGQALTPDSFGYLNTEINEWVSKTQAEVKAVVDAGGTNSFMLDFDDATSLTTLGYDKSSKGNNWTLNNFSLTAGTTYDHMLDAPGNSYATLNPLYPSGASARTFSEANLRVAGGAAGQNSTEIATVQMVSGKWYYEATVAVIGTASITGVGTFAILYQGNGTFYPSGSGASFTTNDVIGVAVDIDAGTVQFFKNGASQGTVTGTAGAATFPTFALGGAASAPQWWANFGQRPFAYTPPTGFKALCQANLPDVAAGVLSPKKNFDVMLATGANIKTTSESVFPSNFMEWIKDRANSNNHQLLDIVRGASAVLQSNTTGAETTYTAPAGNSVGWVWKAGGAAVSNTAGSITSQVSANVDAGFSIVTYTGTGANATVGHGLTKVPKLVIVKQRTSGTAENWAVSHTGIANTEYLLLNTTAAKTAGATYWNSTTPTTSVFSVGSAADTNESAKDFVAYCFTDIEGYSKIGSYTGAASATGDGPCVNLGFKPKFLMGKRTDVAGPWWIVDGAREPSNKVYLDLQPNSAYIENNVTDQDPGQFDFTSNGFKVRTLSGDTNAAYTNATGGTYIFIAFADVAGKYSLGR